MPLKHACSCRSGSWARSLHTRPYRQQREPVAAVTEGQRRLLQGVCTCGKPPPASERSTCALGHRLAEQPAVLETPITRTGHAHDTYVCVASSGWVFTHGDGHSRVHNTHRQTEPAPFLHGDPLLRPDRRHHRCPTPGQLRQFGLEVCHSDFPCRRSREISAAASWGLGKSLRTHPPGVGHPSKPRVLAQSENPPSEQRPRQRALTKLPTVGNTGATAAVATCGPITCAADARHPFANKFVGLPATRNRDA